MDRLKVNQVRLCKSKRAAQDIAKTIRNAGFRAEVRPSGKITQKRSPSLKWAVDKGQRRK